jgi:hypothetical protein
LRIWRLAPDDNKALDTTNPKSDIAAMSVSPSGNDTLQAVLNTLIPRMSKQATVLLIRNEYGVAHARMSLLTDVGLNVNLQNAPNVIAFVPDVGWYLAIDVFGLNGRFDATRTADLVKMFAGHWVVLLNAFSREAQLDLELPVPWFTSVWSADKPSRIAHFGGGRNWRGTRSFSRPRVSFEHHPGCSKLGNPHIRLAYKGPQSGLEMAAEIAYEVEI